LVFLLAIVQLLLPTVAAWADAAIEREAAARRTPLVHIEAHTFNECARIHPADCVLCHAAGATYTAATAESFALPVSRSTASLPATESARASSPERTWDAQPRAPPALG
jgi:hypothetical protein